MTLIKKALLAPVWVLQVFGMSKSFRDNPVLGSALLNRLGLHVARLVLAHLMTRFRRTILTPLATPGHRRTLAKQGFVVIEDFLPPDDFTSLHAEVRRYTGEVREMVQGDTLTLRGLLDNDALRDMPICRGLLENHPVYESLLMYCSSRRKRPLYYIQSIKNGYVAGGPDPQKVLHSDTFHPTMKAWFFLDDVDDVRGPFTYVPGSHRLTRARIAWEYRRSMHARMLRDGYSEKGSMRASIDDLRDMGLPDPLAIRVRKNTLVVADTHGFHCRGAAQPGTSRLEIWSYSRTNPFNPWPGIGLRIISRWEYRMAKVYWRWADKRAARRNVLSTWHRVPSEKIHELRPD